MVADKKSEDLAPVLEQRVADWLFSHRRIALTFTLVLGLLGGLFSLSLRFDNSLEVWFLDGDPTLVSYRQFLDLFDSDELIIVAWSDPQLLTEAGLQRVDEVAAIMEGFDDVLNVYSITDAEEIVSQGGDLVVRKAISRPLDQPSPELVAQLLDNPLVGGTLLGGDGTHTAVVAQVAHREGDMDYKFAMVAGIREQLATLTEKNGLKYMLSGTPVFDEAFFRYTNRDTVVFLPLVLVFITATMVALFRSANALLYALAVVLPALLFAQGTLAAAGIRVTVVHTIIPPLLLAVGIADSVHLLAFYGQLRREGKAPRDAAHRACVELLPPCLATSMTTGIGLLSLLTSDLAPLREVGVIGAAGVVAAFAFTFTTAPVLLPRVKVSLSGRTQRPSVIQRALATVAEIAVGHPYKVAASGFVMLACFVVAISNIHIGANSIDYFKESDPVYQDIVAIDRALGGAFSVEVLITADEPGGIKDPDVLRRMVETQQMLETIPGVTHSFSVADLVMEIDKALNDHDPGRLPATRSAVAQYLLLVEGQKDLAQVVDLDYSTARVSARMQAFRAEETARHVPQMHLFLADKFNGAVKAKSTGLSELMFNMEIYLLHSQLTAFALAFLLATVVLILVLRSWRLGLFSSIANLAPIAMTLGIMGWLGISLDAGTVMIAPVALGLVVDDTVHFLHHIKLASGRGVALKDAIRKAIHFAGPPITMTTVILACGFWVLLAASFRPNIAFGGLCGSTMILALVADLVWLPALLVIAKPKIHDLPVQVTRRDDHAMLDILPGMNAGDS